MSFRIGAISGAQPVYSAPLPPAPPPEKTANTLPELDTLLYDWIHDIKLHRNNHSSVILYFSDTVKMIWEVQGYDIGHGLEGCNLNQGVMDIIQKPLCCGSPAQRIKYTGSLQERATQYSFSKFTCGFDPVPDVHALSPYSHATIEASLWFDTIWHNYAQGVFPSPYCLQMCSPTNPYTGERTVAKELWFDAVWQQRVPRLGIPSPYFAKLVSSVSPHEECTLTKELWWAAYEACGRLLQRLNEPWRG